MAMKQLGFIYKTHGGARKGAGRKPAPGRRRMAHRARAAHSSRHPLHVTLRVADDVANLRRVFGVVKSALEDGAERFGFRLLHYSVQSNHLHLLVEAKDAMVLSRAMTGLTVRLARGLNRHLQRRGQVFPDRYHARELKTPREVRNAIAYVLLNSRKHARERGRQYPPDWMDPCSSAASFDGWRHTPGRRAGGTNLAKPHTWLATTGWRRHGLLSPAEIPGVQPRGGRKRTVPT